MSILTYIIVAGILLGAELVYFAIARKAGILDRPNDRSMHRRPTIRGGGIVFYIAGLTWFFVADDPSLYFFVALSLVSLVGLADDILNLSARVRFGVQGLAFALLLYDIAFGTQGPIWVGVAFVICVGTLNAYNFMDGINGITGGYSAVVLAGLYYVNEVIIHFADSSLFIIILIALLIFNFFNFRKKAVCFAGDVGSLSIGFIVIYLILKLIIATDNYCAVAMLAVYAADSLLTIAHRLIRKENILEAHKLHLFQVIVSKTGIPHLAMTGVYMVAQALITTVIIMAWESPLPFQYLQFFIIALVLTVVYVSVKIRMMKSE